MITFGKDYIYHSGKIYKEIKPDTSRPTIRWNLVDKKGKRRWITKQQLETIIKTKEEQNEKKNN